MKVAVIGAGLMGQKIAGNLAFCGFPVRIYDFSSSSLDSVFERLNEDKKHLSEAGILGQRSFTGQVLCLSHLADVVKNADFVFEAIIEDLAAKQSLFEAISAICSNNTVLATNSLRLDVEDVFARTQNTKRALGLRFLFPVYYVPEVEITPCSTTSCKTIEKVRHLLNRMGKTLFFRSGGEPLILTEDQREERKRDFIAQRATSCAGLLAPSQGPLPNLGHIPAASEPCPRGESFPEDISDLSPSPSSSDCAICMDKPRDCVLSPCHHMVSCSECIALLVSRHDGCPVCRKPIGEVIKVYQS